MDNKCKQCGVPVPFTNRNKKVPRKFCSRACMGLFARTKFPPQFCLNCGKELIRGHLPCGLMRRTSGLNKPRCCSYACSVQYRTGKPIKEIVTPGQFRRRVKDKRADCCEACGTSDGRIAIHHIDNDFANNDPSNLKTLCASCHNKEHWETNWKHRKKSDVCTICGRKSLTRGLCNSHYMRLIRYGNPLLIKKSVGNRKFILVEDRGFKFDRMAIRAQKAALKGNP